MHTSNTKFFVLFLNNTNMCECVSEGYVIMMGARFWKQQPIKNKKHFTLMDHHTFVQEFSTYTIKLFYKGCILHTKMTAGSDLNPFITNIQNTHIRYLKKTNTA